MRKALICATAALGLLVAPTAASAADGAVSQCARTAITWEISDRLSVGSGFGIYSFTISEPASGSLCSNSGEVDLGSGSATVHYPTIPSQPAASNTRSFYLWGDCADASVYTPSGEAVGALVGGTNLELYNSDLSQWDEQQATGSLCTSTRVSAVGVQVKERL